MTLKNEFVDAKTPLVNVDDMRTPAQRESDAWLDGIHANMPRFQDKDGEPVTMKTPLSKLNGFDI